MVTAWLIGALTLTAPTVYVTDGEACVAEARLAEELAQLLPDAEVDVRVSTTGAAQDDVALTLQVSSPREAPEAPLVLMQRTLTVVRSDCPAVAPLLARIVSRRLEGLPRHQWQRITAPPPAPEERDGAVSLFVEGGASVGLDRPDPRGHLAIGMIGTLTHGLVGLLGVAAALTHEVPVGDGQARIASAGLLAGLGWREPVGPVELLGQLTVTGGLSIGQGTDFDDNQTALMPMVEGSAGFTVITPAAIHLTLAVDVPIARTRLLEEGSVSGYEEPQVRVRLGLGFIWP